MAAIVFIDVDDTMRAARRMMGQDEHALWSVFVELFSLAFARAGGMYYQHLGDGCLGFFADPVLSQYADERLPRDSRRLRAPVVGAKVRVASISERLDRVGCRHPR